jgi:hypothetical protein
MDAFFQQTGCQVESIEEKADVMVAFYVSKISSGRRGGHRRGGAIRFRCRQLRAGRLELQRAQIINKLRAFSPLRET